VSARASLGCVGEEAGVGGIYVQHAASFGAVEPTQSARRALRESGARSSHGKLMSALLLEPARAHRLRRSARFVQDANQVRALLTNVVCAGFICVPEVAGAGVVCTTRFVAKYFHSQSQA